VLYLLPQPSDSIPCRQPAQREPAAFFSRYKRGARYFFFSSFRCFIIIIRTQRSCHLGPIKNGPPDVQNLKKNDPVLLPDNAPPSFEAVKPLLSGTTSFSDSCRIRGSSRFPLFTADRRVIDASIRARARRSRVRIVHRSRTLRLKPPQNSGEVHESSTTPLKIAGATKPCRC
jgi:hypothetical protein